MNNIPPHSLALANLLTFLLEHHAEDIGSVSYGGLAGVYLGHVHLKSPPKGATMLSWEWETSQGITFHRTPSGIIIYAPAFTKEIT